MALLKGGVDVTGDLAVPVHDWRETGLHYTGKHAPNRNPRLAAHKVRAVAWHWTAGESDAAAVFHTMMNRTDTIASSHFNIDRAGKITQYADLDQITWTSNTASVWSIGIEGTNEGMDSGNPSSRPKYTDTLNGFTRTMLEFTPMQVRSFILLTKRLCEIFQIPFDYPRGLDGKLVKKILSKSEMARYKGVLGHFHIDRRIGAGNENRTQKFDPGTQLFREMDKAGASGNKGFATFFAIGVGLFASGIGYWLTRLFGH